MNITKIEDFCDALWTSFSDIRSLYKDFLDMFDL